MTDEKIARINALAKKSRTPEGLTAEEKAEQASLRREYIDAMKGSLKKQLDNTVVVDANGQPYAAETKAETITSNRHTGGKEGAACATVRKNATSACRRAMCSRAGPVRPPRPSRARRAAPRPGPEPPRGKRQRRRPVLRRVLLGVLCLFLAACLSVGGYLYASTRNDFLWLDLEQLPHREATILYAQDRDTGEWVEYARLEATQQKIWVPLSEIPEDMQHAFVAIEDKHFYEHHGVSLTRTAYAVLNEMKKALTGTYFGNGIKQGASTIDQQLIKNLTRDDEAGGLEGYMRKVREIWRAYRLDAKYDKETILEAYLNVISFTDNTAGVEAESIKLFGKSARDLSLAQCASIASITKTLTGTTRAPMKKSI